MADVIIAAVSKLKDFAPDDSEPPFDPYIHLRSPAPAEEQTAKIAELRQLLESHAKYASLYSSHSAWADDSTLQRFLVARNYKVADSLNMIIEALQWREKRRPSEIDTKEGWEDKMSVECETGKIYCPGHDKWKRPVIIFDNTVQNTPHVDDHMTFLAWNLEFAIKLMPSTVDKYLVFMHLENFSFWNNPSFAATRETIHMLCNCFPERLGHCVAYRPPGIFRTVFDAVKGFLDPRTVGKMIFITGDVSDGSENDKLLSSIIGADWKVLTGAEQPQPDTKISPGYNHLQYWLTVRERLAILRSGESVSGKETESSTDVESLAALEKLAVVEVEEEAKEEEEEEAKEPQSACA